MTVVTRGEREISQRFDEFPTAAHERLRQRITRLVDELQERAQAAAPERTGQLKSEITGRVFADNPQRVAGYVGIQAPSSNDYAKAAALEYGVNKPRKIVARAGRAQRRIIERLSKTVHMRAFRYLRDSIEAMRPEIESELAAALNETAEE
jgi:hypothetical protein